MASEEGGTTGGPCISGSDDIKVKSDPFPSSPHSLLSSSSSLSSFSPASCSFDHQGSHQALQKAFLGLKQRLDDSNSQNHVLIRKVKRLESALDSAAGRGVASPNTMDAAVGSDQLQDGEEAGLQQAAEEGFANNLQRQLGRARVQLQVYQEKLQENDAMKQELDKAHAQIKQLSEEMTTLQQKYEDEKQEKEGAMQVLNDLRQKHDSLQLEKDKMIKDAAILHNSLRKAHHELAMLKEKQGEGTESVNATELAAEVAYMRRVIKNLKDMVLDQKQRLGNCGKMLSMSKPSLVHSYHDPGSIIGESNSSPLSSSRPAGSASGQSWEMVNITHPPSLNPRQQQEQQQQQQLRAMQQRCVTSSSSAVQPSWAAHNMVSNNATVKPPVMKMDAYRPQTLCNGPPPKMWGSQSEVLQRHPNQGVALPPKSRTDVLKSNASKPHDFVDGNFPPLFLGEERTSQTPAHKLAALSPDPLMGLNQLGDMADLAQDLTSPTRAPSAGATANHAMFASQLMKGHPAPLGVDSFSNSKTSPSMHILNPGVMAGARVIRNDSDSFGSSGGTVMMASYVGQGFSPSAPMNQQEAGPLPQEHDDGTQFTAAMSELSPMDESNFINRPVINPAGQSALDRKCPVCGQDFSHLSMDEFQIHVFECFDNAEENASAPQTLQAENRGKEKTGGGDRVCPMCQKRFPGSTTQAYFEGHVQSHFEEQSRVAEQFEVLNLKEQ